MSFDEWTQKQAQRLAQTITLQHTETEHSACLDALEAYIDAQLARRDYARLFPSVAQHLDSCVACAASYALVYEARTADVTTLSQIRVPAPDLSFLQPDRATLLQRRLVEAVERIAPQRLRIRLSQALLDLLPPPTPALALRSIASDIPLLSMTLDQPADAIQIQLSIYEEHDAPELCALRSQVSLDDREWPELAGIVVRIIIDGEQREATTDPWGEAVFAGVPRAALDGLQLEVNAGNPPQTST
ncbi:MAG: hypothetical protein JOZ51_17290 [Chloroflexi bacterium]|nr:hypothetical protein [Chloroflexota bacterium]